MFWRQKQTDPLDAVLFHLTRLDPVVLRDFLTSWCIFGRTGSGKTSSSGKQIARAILAQPSGGLICSAKPEDREMWEELFRSAGRGKDLVVFDVGGKWHFDFLDYIRQLGGAARDITRAVMTIGETLRSSDTKGGEDGDFWQQQTERMIYNAVEMLRLAHGRVTAPEMLRFVTTAAVDAKQLATAEWQAEFHNQTIARAHSRPKKPIEQHDYDLAAAYWLGEFPQMAERTRSSITVCVLGILHVFNTGQVRELVSSGTNVSPDVMPQGKWVLVDMAPAVWGDMGNFVNAGWKYLTQKMVLRRKAAPGDPPVVIWCDEAQQFVNSHDAHYLAQCRSHMGCMVYLTQSLHSYFSALKGKSGEHQAKALLANFGTKVFHALGDAESAEFASKLVGNRLQTYHGSSMTPDEGLWDAMMGNCRITGSTSEHLAPIIEPREFMHGLRTGGRENGLCCDAVVVKSGMPFSNGESFLPVTFSQKG